MKRTQSIRMTVTVLGGAHPPAGWVARAPSHASSDLFQRVGKRPIAERDEGSAWPQTVFTLIALQVTYPELREALESVPSTPGAHIVAPKAVRGGRCATFRGPPWNCSRKRHDAPLVTQWAHAHAEHRTGGVAGRDLRILCPPVHLLRLRRSRCRAGSGEGAPRRPHPVPAAEGVPL